MGDDKHHWNNLGNFYTSIGRLDDATNAYRQSAALDITFAFPWYGLGNVYFAVGRYAEALEGYQEALDRDPAFAASWNGLGNAHNALGAHSEALVAYQRCVELDAANMDAWNGLGVVYRKLKRYAEAIAAYAKVIELDPVYAWPYNNLGVLHEIRGDYQLAAQFYQNAIDHQLQDKGRAVSCFNLADLYRKMGRNAEAVDIYERAMALDYTLVHPWHGLGYLYLCSGEDAGAELALTRAVDLADVGHYAVLLTMGILRYRQGRTDDGRRLFADALARCVVQDDDDRLSQAWLLIASGAYVEGTVFLRDQLVAGNFSPGGLQDTLADTDLLLDTDVFFPGFAEARQLMAAYVE